MPVYIYEKDAFPKFVEAECGGSKANERKEFIETHAEKMGDFSFFSFLRRWYELYAQDPDIENDQTRAIDVNGTAKMRGLNGNNLYFVLHSGEIILARPKETSIKNLLWICKMGFRVRDEDALREAK